MTNKPYRWPPQPHRTIQDEPLPPTPAEDDAQQTQNPDETSPETPERDPQQQ